MLASHEHQGGSGTIRDVRCDERQRRGHRPRRYRAGRGFVSQPANRAGVQPLVARGRTVWRRVVPAVGRRKVPVRGRFDPGDRNDDGE